MSKGEQLLKCISEATQHNAVAGQANFAVSNWIIRLVERFSGRSGAAVKAGEAATVKLGNSAKPTASGISETAPVAGKKTDWAKDATHQRGSDSLGR